MWIWNIFLRNHQSIRYEKCMNCLKFCSSSNLNSIEKTDSNKKVTKRQRKAMEKELRNVIIGTHVALRKEIKEIGDERAENIWKSHLKNENLLKEYSTTICTLVSKVWEPKNKNSRIVWCYNEIDLYFNKGLLGKWAEKEIRKASFFPDLQQDFNEAREYASNFEFRSPYKVLDVGSCYNPFEIYEDLDVTAIDIYPMSPKVKKGDFISLKIKNKKQFYDTDYSNSPNMKRLKTDNYIKETLLTDSREHSPEHSVNAQQHCYRENNDQLCCPENNEQHCHRAHNEKTKQECFEEIIFNTGENKIAQQHCSEEDKSQNAESINELCAESFDILIFSFLLSYIPSPRLRFMCCKKAYDLLKPNGILVVMDPDARRSARNSYLEKIRNTTMKHLGFDRVKYEKKDFFHAAVYRKAFCRRLYIIDGKTDLKQAKLKKENIKLVDRFQNFDYDSVPFMYYIMQDLNDSLKDENKSLIESGSLTANNRINVSLNDNSCLDHNNKSDEYLIDNSSLTTKDKSKLMIIDNSSLSQNTNSTLSENYEGKKDNDCKQWN